MPSPQPRFSGVATRRHRRGRYSPHHPSSPPTAGLATYGGYRTPCPSDVDAFSYRPTCLKDWSMPETQWDVLPLVLQGEIAKLQHAGAAVLTGFSRLEEMDWPFGSQADISGEVEKSTSQEHQVSIQGDLDLYSDRVASLPLDDISVARLQAPPPRLTRKDEGTSSLGKGIRSSLSSLQDRLGEDSPPASLRTRETSLSRRPSNNPPMTAPVSPSSPIDLWSLKPVNRNGFQTHPSSRVQSPYLSPSPSFLLPLGFHVTSIPPLTPGSSRAASPTKDSRPVLEPQTPTYYLAELSHLRSDALVRLRHAVRRVDIEWAEMQRIQLRDCDVGSKSTSSSGGMDREECLAFEQWWEGKRALAGALEEKCIRLVSEVREILE
ncbi:hypothetical protein NA57DRAFT_74060 [Rhizodiscina lignyota]|uniref:Uncharacterized protein n=1 Tax=Rhizodiscina lignyota TaxID=1504668 RepID=A0A9P4M789_9PEZI|nr:hypothetical protein NA57DRAFT_74060 [Rhizodiscina lignyota]